MCCLYVGLQMDSLAREIYTGMCISSIISHEYSYTIHKRRVDVLDINLKSIDMILRGEY